MPPNLPLPPGPSYVLTAVAGAYIQIKITGPITRDRAHEFTAAAHALGKRLGIHGYLVDATEARNTDTIPGNYEFAYVDMRSPGMDRQARIAVLVHPDDRSHNFVETAMQNAGVAFALFRDRAAALKHLDPRASRSA